MLAYPCDLPVVGIHRGRRDRSAHTDTSAMASSFTVGSEFAEKVASSNGSSDAIEESSAAGSVPGCMTSHASKSTSIAVTERHEKQLYVNYVND